MCHCDSIYITGFCRDGHIYMFPVTYMYKNTQKILTKHEQKYQQFDDLNKSANKYE